MKVVDLYSEYKIRDEQSVLLSIRVGDAQIGTSVVFLEDTEVGRGDGLDLELGLGSEIRGKKLRIKSVVTDVNDKTNRTSITYRLTGGVLDQSFCSKGTVDENGDSIIFRAVFSLA